MPLVHMSEILQDAARENRGVGSFSVSNLEMVKGAITAAEKAETPIILQIAQVRLNTSPLHLIGPLMLAAAHEAKVNIAVHLDHGMDLPTIEQALKLGFTSVMIDGSELDITQNIALTRKVVKLARSYGADVEAEMGRIGRTESGKDSPMVYADPKETIRFIDQTEIDALAVGIGNSHGVYAQAPRLRFDILAEISKNRHTPLVLHGGTGLTGQDYQTAITHGIRKINIATASFQAVFRAARRVDVKDFFDMSTQMTNAMQEVVSEHLNLFGLKR